jgi:DNA-directed RNA polymerase subunit M/transcription elongation factor TFIIS
MVKVEADVVDEAKDEPAKIVYYCKDCKRIVDSSSRKGKKKYSFKCSLCGGKDVSYGTEKSIIGYYRIRPVQLKEWGLEA